MEFAKYYNVTDTLNKMISDKKVYAYEKGAIHSLYICKDTHDFWICRILENINEEYEKEEGKWLVERNKVDKYDFCERVIEDNKNSNMEEVNSRYERDNFIDRIGVHNIIETVIIMDDVEGLSNWDIYECYDLEECLDIVDGGWGFAKMEGDK